MSFVKLRMLLILLVFLSLGFLSVLNILGLIRPAELIAQSTESPVIIVRDNDFLCTGISQIVSDNENIYILYGKYSVVQVYTHDGEYCYSISIYNHMNGRTEIAAHRNCLYICDKINNVYIINDGEIEQYIDRHESYSIRSRIAFGAWDPAYTVQSGSVWYSSDGIMRHCVIRRPGWLSIYQNDMISLLMLILIAFAGAILFIHKNPSTGN